MISNNGPFGIQVGFGSQITLVGAVITGHTGPGVDVYGHSQLYGTSQLPGLELSGLKDVNDGFNENGASRYVTDQGMKQIGGQAEQEFKVVDDMTATGFSGTDPNAHHNSGAAQTLGSDLTNIGVASVKAVLPAASTWMQ